MAEAAAIAIDIIRKRGSMRTPALADELGIGEAAVDAMLESALLDGRLICCNVETGGRCVVEYRLSMAGGGKLVSYMPSQPKPAAPAAPRNEPISPAGAMATQEEPVTFKERMEAFFKKHGPMTVVQMREHSVKDAGLATLLGQAGFARLGGGKRSTVWGLPGQALPKTDALKRGAELGKKGQAKGAHRATRPAKRGKRAGGGSVAMRRKSPVKRAAKAFRPALAADGAILCIGAEYGELELDKGQTRVLLDVARKLTPPELAAVVTFLERLDGAEVGA